MIRLLPVILTLVLFSLPNLANAHFIDSTSGESFPDVKAKKTAAIIYQLYFFIDFDNAQYDAQNDVQPEFCFVGEESFGIGEVLKQTQESRKRNTDVSISYWQQTKDVPLSYCHIIYNAKPNTADKEITKALSKASMTITTGPNLKETGNIASISFQGTAVTFVFSRKHLRRSSLEVNHQLIRASIVVP